MTIISQILLSESQLKVRRNVNCLSYKDWEEFKRGIRLMKERSIRNMNDPLGFYYQTNIHGWPEYDGSERARRIADRFNWHRCQHGHYFFLVWHRMYIYFFERILQKVTNNPELTIPFWDYFEEDSRAMPQPFRMPANNITNPLFAYERCKNMNEGKPLSSRVVSPYPALSSNFFTTYKQNNELNLCHSFGGGRIDRPAFLSDREGLIERIPHDNVHLHVGGPNGFMSDLCQSARDPIFFIHHSQTDRIWESWIRAGGTHDAERLYLNTTFDFFDENGELGSYRVGDFLDTKALGYVYESYIRSDPVQLNKNERPKVYLPVDEKNDLNINYNKRFITLKMKPHWNKFFWKLTNRQFDGLNIKFTLQFDVEYLERDIIFEIYLNLNEEITPYDCHPNFLGHMVTFEEHCVESLRREQRSISKCYDITKPLIRAFNNDYSFEGYYWQTINLTFIPKFCDKLYYPANNEDVIRFNEVIIDFFRTDEVLPNYESSSFASYSMDDVDKQKDLFDKTLSTLEDELPPGEYSFREETTPGNLEYSSTKQDQSV